MKKINSLYATLTASGLVLAALVAVPAAAKPVLPQPLALITPCPPWWDPAASRVP
jgi:hypothetical protein